MSSSGVSDSSNTKGDAVGSSTTVKTGPETVASSNDLRSMKREVVASASSSPPKPLVITGASTVLSTGVGAQALAPSGSRGKEIVSDDVVSVLTFKDVTFGPHQGELRFRLVHFWEAWNAQTKALMGLEMLMIDQEVYTDHFCS